MYVVWEITPIRLASCRASSRFVIARCRSVYEMLDESGVEHCCRSEEEAD